MARRRRGYVTRGGGWRGEGVKDGCSNVNQLVALHMHPGQHHLLPTGRNVKKRKKEEEVFVQNRTTW